MKGKIDEAIYLLKEIYNSIDRCNEKVTVPIMVALRNMEQVQRYLESKGEKNEGERKGNSNLGMDDSCADGGICDLQ